MIVYLAGYKVQISIESYHIDKDKVKSITGLKSAGDRICSKGETVSSTKALTERCLEINGGILVCHDLKPSFFSASNVRYLRACKY